MIVNSNRLRLRAGFETWFDQERSAIGDSLDEYARLNKVVVSDCDGILTDGRSVYGGRGKKYKFYGSYDKEMMLFLRGFGWKFVFVTDDSEGMPVTKARLDHLNGRSGVLEYRACGWSERLGLVRDFLGSGHVVAFIGDSLSDIASLNVATFACTTANAPAEVKKYCDFVSELDGASGGFADLLYHVHLKTAEDVGRPDESRFQLNGQASPEARPARSRKFR